MFKTRKFQSWARVGATYLPPSLPPFLFLTLSLCPFSLPPLFLPFLSLLFVFFLLQLRNSTNSAKLSAHHNARSVSLSPSLCHTLALISGCPRNSFAAQSACLPAKLICFATNCCTNKHNAISINFMAHLFAKHLSQHLPASPACPTTTCRHPLGHTCPLHFLPLSPIH